MEETCSATMVKFELSVISHSTRREEQHVVFPAYAPHCTRWTPAMSVGLLNTAVFSCLQSFLLGPIFPLPTVFASGLKQRDLHTWYSHFHQRSREDDSEGEFGGKKGASFPVEPLTFVADIRATGGSEHFNVVVARPFARDKLRDVDRVPGLPRTWITLTGPKAMLIAASYPCNSFFVREVSVTKDVAKLTVP
ncbi:hypothetical protein ARMGADRAFT_1172536 [Armillaria gallica]|uniref:Uncharacterized protein n=1 Tax=Armillaria gallica TaxID=47427 RepID=A0A2H3CSG0_ARMGA|nr:hypothetical protein ARMGADRAFT_1172536 [Armillaria gallica]